VLSRDATDWQQNAVGHLNNGRPREGGLVR
jgi:hypothetical protein